LQSYTQSTLVCSALAIVLTGCAGAVSTTTPSVQQSPGGGTVGLSPSGVALKIVNNNSAAMPSSGINIYVYGQIPGSAGPTWQYVTAAGSTVAMTNNGANIPPIPFGSGSTSQTIYLPPMTSCRIYIVGGTFNFNIPTTAPVGAGPNVPAPWTNDGSRNLYFDFVEYTWNPPAAMNVDTTQVDGFNLAMSVTLTGASTSTFGFLGGAVTQLHNALAGYGGQWATLNAQWPFRVTNPGHGNQSGFFTDSTFLDSAARTAWDAYKTQFMTLDLSGAGFSTYYGQVDANENFNFYTTPNTSGTLVGTIVSPFSPANVALWGSPTMQILANSGAFANVPSGQNAGLVLAIGNRVVGALNRGTFGTLSQPACGVVQYPGSAYQNQYANAVHAIANQPQYGYGGAYAFAYDDSCATSTDTSQTSPTAMTIQINPS